MNKPLAQNYLIVWHNSDPEYYVEGCGLLRLDGGEWLAVVPVLPRSKFKKCRVTHSRIKLLHSHDGGQTWKLTGTLPYYAAVPFQHRGDIYLFAMKGGAQFRNDDLLLLRSGDGGRIWSEPVTLFQGHFWNCQTGMARRDDHIYWAVDDLSFGDPYFRGPCVVAGDLSRDLMDQASWRMSNPVPFPGLPDMLKDPADRAQFGKYLEPNVININGRLRVLCAVRKNGICAVFDIKDNGDKVRLAFTQYHPMPGGQYKFCLLRDEPSRLFWATANPLVNSQELLDWSDLRPGPEACQGG
ncbi:MAG: hypothetical protein ABR497_03005, partial [Kiritimatiellia bacterium]